MWQYQNTDELYHYGVLGMKWGVRKNKEKYDNLSNEEKLKMINEKYDKKIRRQNKSSTVISNSMLGLSGASLAGALFINSIFFPISGGLIIGSMVVNRLKRKGEEYLELKRSNEAFPYGMAVLKDTINNRYNYNDMDDIDDYISKYKKDF